MLKLVLAAGKLDKRFLLKRLAAATGLMDEGATMCAWYGVWHRLGGDFCQNERKSFVFLVQCFIIESDIFVATVETDSGETGNQCRKRGAYEKR